MKPNPPFLIFLSFLMANFYLLSGRLHFPRERIGEKIKIDDKAEFTVFRQAYLNPPRSENGKPPGARFVVRFHVEKMSPEVNKVFSLFTIPFFAGLEGFRSKIWLLDEAGGDCMGIYEWQTVEDARNYSESFAMRFMTNRSVEGSVSFEIKPIN
ncbi:MAG: hypothetical protein JW984_08380 [Deltaproteobacteria bacterium]|uniref:Uncharacterized protein n=1 Tax=Candidatus Zymogenus saltonus TaxID=2844893 RepID=A0A9D8KFQ4_9DELT|nr:hypothetical protein [Candidatus Zymogenus saltonus]